MDLIRGQAQIRGFKPHLFLDNTILIDDRVAALPNKKRVPGNPDPVRQMAEGDFTEEATLGIEDFKFVNVHLNELGFSGRPRYAVDRYGRSLLLQSYLPAIGIDPDASLSIGRDAHRNPVQPRHSTCGAAASPLEIPFIDHLCSIVQRPVCPP